MNGAATASNLGYRLELIVTAHLLHLNLVYTPFMLNGDTLLFYRLNPAILITHGIILT